MQDNSWREAFSELTGAIAAAMVRLWKQDILQVGLAIGMFLALALPLLIVIVLLWYLDSTGWRPQGGFYKIGLGPAYLPGEVRAALAAWSAAASVTLLG
jgi:hypothetical protein